MNWRTGEIAPAALADVDVPVILDGAQGAGAIPVDVVKLGCAAYAAAGQKWLCGADGTGLLYLAPAFRDRVRAMAPSYLSFEDASLGFESSLKPDARRHDTPSLSRESIAFSAASLDVLREADLAAVLARGPALAATFAERLAAHGRTVAPRGHTTLVSFEDDDPEGTRDRLLEAGVLVRNLPGTPLVRASVGAWSSEDDLERLLAAHLAAQRRHVADPVLLAQEPLRIGGRRRRVGAEPRPLARRRARRPSRRAGPRAARTCAGRRSAPSPRRMPSSQASATCDTVAPFASAIARASSTT